MHNQLRPDLGFFTLQGRTLNFSYDVAPLADAAATSHKSPRKLLIATKTRIIIASHQKLDFHVIIRL
jgi:hypothetical protein